MWANEAARLVWLLGPAGFPEGSGEKSISSSSRQNREACQIELLPACPWLAAGQRPEWIPRRTAIVHAALTRVSPGYGGLSEPQLGCSSLPAQPSRSEGPCCAVGGRWRGRVGPGWPDSQVQAPCDARRQGANSRVFPSGRDEAGRNSIPHCFFGGKGKNARPVARAP